MGTANARQQLGSTPSQDMTPENAELNPYFPDDTDLCPEDLLSPSMVWAPAGRANSQGLTLRDLIFLNTSRGSPYFGQLGEFIAQRRAESEMRAIAAADALLADEESAKVREEERRAKKRAKRRKRAAPGGPRWTAEYPTFPRGVGPDVFL